MSSKPRITLEEVINTIGDEAGEKYAWFLIGFEAQGIISEHIDNGDISDKINSEPLGYYEVSWDFIKFLSKKLSAVVIFDLVGSKSKEDFLNERAKVHSFGDFVCELDFWIEDGEIWEITGTDTSLVERLKKTFSPLPIMLM